jgi:uncharacterized iron-regulated protein
VVTTWMSATIHSITDAARKPDAKDDAGGLHHEAMIAELKAQLEATRQKLQVAEKRAESWRRLFEAERAARQAAAAEVVRAAARAARQKLWFT